MLETENTTSSGSRVIKRLRVPISTTSRMHNLPRTHSTTTKLFGYSYNQGKHITSVVTMFSFSGWYYIQDKNPMHSTIKYKKRTYYSKSSR